MHRGMEILMSRMDSHPEEFDITFQHLSASRWRFVLKPLIDRCEAVASKEPCFLLGFLSDQEVSDVFELLQEERGERVPLRRFGGGGADDVMTVPRESGS
jgi:hypothetical protein